MAAMQYRCVICMRDFVSFEKRECCSPACATQLSRIMCEREANRYKAFCMTCQCEGAFCLNRLYHATFWQYDGPKIHYKIHEPIEPKPIQAQPQQIHVNVKCNKEHTSPLQPNNWSKSELKSDDAGKALMDIKKMIPKESTALIGLGLAAGIIIKAYFLWTFAAGTAAAYAYKMWSDKQGK